jgi:hypothetical protein
MMTKLFAGADEESGRRCSTMKAFTIGIAFAGGPGRHAIARIILPGGSLEELHDDATEFEFSPIMVCR